MTAMSDVDILTKKNSEVTKLKMIRAVLILAVIVLLGFIAAVAFIVQVSPPSPTPRIDVITDSTPIKVPEVITVGEPFTYQTSGVKHYENSGEVRLQTVCKVNGNEVINSFSTFYSNLHKGEYNLSRTTSMTKTARTVNSDNCTLQSIASYTFYLVDNGVERNFTVTEFNESNKFKQIVPEDAEEGTSTTNGERSPLSNAAQVPSLPTAPQPQSPNPTPVPTPDVIEPQPPQGLRSIPLVDGLLNFLSL